MEIFYVKQHPNLHVEEEIADDKWGAHPNELFLLDSWTEEIISNLYDSRRLRKYVIRKI